MGDLLDLVFEAHGGLDEWRKVACVDLRLTMRGEAAIKRGGGLKDVQVRIDTRRRRTLMTPYPAPGRRGLFADGRVTIETDAGVPVSGLAEPRQSFAGYEVFTPWSPEQFLYFVGYALNNYLTMPFLLAENGVTCEELAPHEEHGETWRVLKATFPAGLHVHCPVQTFYFNSQGHLVRNDYAPEVSGGGAASHYTYDHRFFDDFLFPTHRRVVRRDETGRSLLSAPSIFVLDIGQVVVTRG
jgi:hypothetical protein